MDEANASMMIAISLFATTPMTIELPVSSNANIALCYLEPDYPVKFIAMKMQNSKPRPRLVTKLTTKT